MGNFDQIWYFLDTKFNFDIQTPYSFYLKLLTGARIVPVS